MKFKLRHHHMPEHPELTLWAVPCVGCFRNENEAVWYFRANHPGSIYTGIEGEQEIKYLCQPLNKEEQKTYDIFRVQTNPMLDALKRSQYTPLPQLDIFSKDSKTYWERRALKAETKLNRILSILSES